MSDEFFNLSSEVYEIFVEFKALCSLIDTLHTAASGDQILDDDTILTYTGIMKDYSNKIRKKLDKAYDMTAEGEKQQPSIMRMDPVIPGKWNGCFSDAIHLSPQVEASEGPDIASAI